MSTGIAALWPSWLTGTRSVQFVVLVAAFAAVTAAVASGATSGFDEAVNRYFISIQGNAGLDIAMIVITTLGDVGTLIVLAIILTIIRRTRKTGMIFLISIVIIAILVMYMKPLIGRPMPAYEFEPATDLPENFLESDSLAPFAADFSYPSGHTARATALAFIVGFALNKLSRHAGMLIWIFPVAVGITRLYVMEHYPMDLVGGFLLGLIISVILSNLMKLDHPFLMSRFKGKEKL